ncbi:MAG: amidohydrolase family protein [Balneolales bacterium]
MIDFIKLPKIDAHVHYNVERQALLSQAEKFNFRFLTINTEIPFFPSITDQMQTARNLQDKAPGLIHYLATFTVDKWEDKSWAENTLAHIRKVLADGANGIKVWKNIGMELKNSKGELVMVDDPQFDPVFNYLATNDIPVLGHLGEPRNCWLPVSEMTVRQDKDYFTAHPEYHMYLHPEYPSYEDQIEARDRMLEKNPGIRFIGAHLSSIEWSVDELARHLDRFPNVAVDLAERIEHVQFQTMDNRQKVRDFMVAYQDRIIYGTDIIEDGTAREEEIIDNIRHRWISQWEYLSTDELQESKNVPRPFKGLKLPEDVLKKIYFENAVNKYRLEDAIQ